MSMYRRYFLPVFVCSHILGIIANQYAWLLGFMIRNKKYLSEIVKRQEKDQGA